MIMEINFGGKHIFLNCSRFIESCSTSTIITGILVSCVAISYAFCDPGGKRKRFRKQIERFPGPRAYPVIGNALQLWLLPRVEIFSWLEGVNKNWGDVVRFWVFGSPKIFVNSYDIATQLLSRKTFLLKSKELDPLASVGRRSLVGATHLLFGIVELAEAHPIRRKLLSPGFGHEAVEGYFQIMNKHISKLCDDLNCIADNETEFNILPLIQLCAIRITCDAALGKETTMDLYELDMKEQIDAWHKVLVHLVHRSAKPWLKSDFVFNLTKEGKEVQDCFRTINGFSERAIYLRRRRRQYLKANRFGYLKPESERAESVKRDCYLDLLLDLEEQNEFTEEDVLLELNIYIVAGYDKIGTAAAWTLHLLASHPENQDKVVQELLQIFPNYRDPDTTPLEINADHLKQMKYLEGCIKESLRLYPVLPWLLRRADEDIELNDGRVIPAGVDVSINTNLIHRDPRYFPEPESFLPERHFKYSYDYDDKPGSSAAKAPLPKLIFQESALLPFGAGVRACPGELFAMHELKIMLTHLLLSYSWESVDCTRDGEGCAPTRMKFLFRGVLVPVNGVNVKIRKREL